VSPGADELLFAPYLAGGEQGILWNPKLRGMLIGLTLAHSAAHIARALLEGMSFEIRRCLELFEEEEPISSVRVTGWITDIPEELQMLSDILGRPVHAFRLESASAVGAALLTGLIDKKKYFANTKAVVFTASERADFYTGVYARYIAQFPTGPVAPGKP
jgi:xylulokinase